MLSTSIQTVALDGTLQLGAPTYKEKLPYRYPRSPITLESAPQISIFVGLAARARPAAGPNQNPADNVPYA